MSATKVIFKMSFPINVKKNFFFNYSSIRVHVTWAPYKQRKCKVVAEESRQRLLSLKIHDVSVS